MWIVRLIGVLLYFAVIVVDGGQIPPDVAPLNSTGVEYQQTAGWMVITCITTINSSFWRLNWRENGEWLKRLYWENHRGGHLRISWGWLVAGGVASWLSQSCQSFCHQFESFMWIVRLIGVLLYFAVIVVDGGQIPPDVAPLNSTGVEYQQTAGWMVITCITTINSSFWRLNWRENGEWLKRLYWENHRGGHLRISWGWLVAGGVASWLHVRIWMQESALIYDVCHSSCIKNKDWLYYIFITLFFLHIHPNLFWETMCDEESFCLIGVHKIS